MMDIIFSTIGGWFVGSFFSATLDYIFKADELYQDSSMLGLFAALIQMSILTVLSSTVFNSLFLRQGKVSTVWNTFMVFSAMWAMSPRATSTLETSYYTIHKFLYGSSPSISLLSYSKKKKGGACCSSCAQGKTCESKSKK